MSDLIREIRIGRGVPSARPRISIIIPNYNTAGFITETLRSVFAQTYTDYEIIVINDAAPDTEELYAFLNDIYDRITFIDKTSNSGTSFSRNLAVEYARGDVLAFLDADDIWHPTFLEEVLAFKDQHGYDMAYADAETFGQAHTEIADFLNVNPPTGEITREIMVRRKCHILPSGSLIDAEKFRLCGGFDPHVARCEDYELFMRFLFAGVRIGYLRKILFQFRLRPGSGSGDSIQRLERGIDVWRILQSKLPFTDEEKAQIAINIKYERAGVLRAEGRLAIVKKDWKTARSKFREALRLAGEIRMPLMHRMRMLGVCTALRIWPSLVRNIQLRLSSKEIAYMPLEANNV